MSLRAGQEDGASENGPSEGMVENWCEGGSLGLTAVHPWPLPGSGLGNSADGLRKGETMPGPFAAV